MAKPCTVLQLAALRGWKDISPELLKCAAGDLGVDATGLAPKRLPSCCLQLPTVTNSILPFSCMFWTLHLEQSCLPMISCTCVNGRPLQVHESPRLDHPTLMQRCTEKALNCSTELAMSIMQNSISKSPQPIPMPKKSRSESSDSSDSSDNDSSSSSSSEAEQGSGDENDGVVEDRLHAASIKQHIENYRLQSMPKKSRTDKQQPKSKAASAPKPVKRSKEARPGGVYWHAPAIDKYFTEDYVTAHLPAGWTASWSPIDGRWKATRATPTGQGMSHHSALYSPLPCQVSSRLKASAT